MQIPKFLMGDHSQYNDSLFVIHTEYPRFIINLVNDEVHFLENLLNEDEEELAVEMTNLIEEASAFYDEEVASYEGSS